MVEEHAEDAAEEQELHDAPHACDNQRPVHMQAGGCCDGERGGEERRDECELPVRDVNDGLAPRGGEDGPRQEPWQWMQLGEEG